MKKRCFKRAIISFIVTIFMLTSCSVDYSFLWANVNFKIEDKLEEGDNENINVILLSGQSNASGVAKVEYLKENVKEEQFNKYLIGFENIKINYFIDDGSNASNGFVNTALNMGCREGYFGPEVGIAEILSEENERVFIIKYSYSGTCLQTKWLDGYNKKNELYYAFVKFVNESLKYLISKNYVPIIRAMCWMQGESDAYEDTAPTYGKALDYFVTNIRKDFKKYIHNNGMVFIDAGISDSYLWSKYIEINNQKLDFSKNENNVYIDTIQEKLTYNLEPIESPDIAHYDSMSMIKLGQLYGKEILKIL